MPISFAPSASSVTSSMSSGSCPSLNCRVNAAAAMAALAGECSSLVICQASFSFAAFFAISPFAIAALICFTSSHGRSVAHSK